MRSCRLECAIGSWSSFDSRHAYTNVKYVLKLAKESAQDIVGTVNVFCD